MWNTVSLEKGEYDSLRDMAEASEQKLNKLAEEKVRERKIIRVNLRLQHGSEYDDSAFVDVTCWNELSPQMEFLVQKVRYWAQEALSEEYKTNNIAQSAIMQINRHKEQRAKNFRSAFIGWLCFGLTATAAVIRLIFF